MKENIRAIAAIIGAIAFAVAGSAKGQYYVEGPYYPNGSQVFTEGEEVVSDLPVPSTGSSHKNSAKETRPASAQKSVVKKSDCAGTAPKLDLASCPCNAKSVHQQKATSPTGYQQKTTSPKGTANKIEPGKHEKEGIPECPTKYHVLEVFPNIELKCDCGDLAQNCCLVRYDADPTGLEGIDPECVKCVQEPYICKDKNASQTEVVIHGCTSKTENSTEEKCKGGKCISETCNRTVKEIMPCKAKLGDACDRIVIEYRPVWIVIQCANKPNCP